MKYLVVDTETGGLDSEKHSILEIAGVVWDPGVGTAPLFNLLVCEMPMSIDAEAIKFNKVDLRKIHDNGLTPENAVSTILSRLQATFGSEKVTLAGHNVGSFDFSFIKRLFKLAGKDANEFFAHRMLDTSTLLRWWIETGKIDLKKPSSDELFKLLDIVIPESDRHTAMGDALATAKALEKLHFWGKTGIL